MKTIKSLLSVFFLGLTTLVFSQSEQSDLPQLPQVSPVSPESANLGKYGDIPVNLASGRINYTIPLFTIKEGDFEYPIQLSYNHSGLMAEDDPGLVGLGWTLEAGGRVVRQVRGKIDEGTNGYLNSVGENLVVPYATGQWDNLPLNEGTEKKLNLFTGAAEGLLDTQPDKIMVNASGLNGSFSYNEIGDPIFYPHKNYKVSHTNENAHFDDFIITNDYGVVYEFKEKEITTQETLSINSYSIQYESSWPLTKLTFPTSNNSIDFIYNTGSIFYKTSHSHTKVKKTSGFGTDCPGCPTGSIPTYYQSDHTTEISTKVISEIQFSQGVISFDIRQVPKESKSRSKDYLHAITIKNKNNQVINRYTFIYNDLNSNFKLLKEVKKYGKGNTQTPFYSFDYHGTPPLEIDYKKQDLWGYYKDAEGFKYLLDGVRDPNYEDTKLGMLKKIHYPTGGYSEIDYELNEISKALAIEENIVCVPPVFNTQEKISYSQSGKAIDFNQEKTILIKEDQIIEVRLGIVLEDSEVLSGHVSVKQNEDEGLDATDAAELCEVENDEQYSMHEVMELGTFLVGEQNNNTKSYFSVKANTILTLKALLSGAGGYGAVNIQVKYFDPELPNPNNDYNVAVGGLRIASTKDCIDDLTCISKHYNYQDENGISSGQVLYSPRYSHIVNRSRLSDDGFSTCQTKVTTAQSRIPMVSFSGAPVVYARVETRINNTGNEGKTVDYYTAHKFNTLNYPFVGVDPPMWSVGKLKQQEVFQKKNNDYILVRQLKNTYNSHYPFKKTVDANKKYSLSFLSGKTRYSSKELDGDVWIFNNLSYYAYDIRVNYPVFHYLSSTEEISYSDRGDLKTKTNYRYQGNTGYLKETTTVYSGGDQLKTVHSYPTDAMLLNSNRIATPIQVESYNNNNKLSHSNIVYNTFGGLYLPEKIQGAKANLPLEDGVLYHAYDEKGHVKEASLKDGTKVYYVWGYNQSLLIAKIEGYLTLTPNQHAAIDHATLLSNTEYSSASDLALRTALEALQLSFSGTSAMASTYTYDPLIGVTSITDPRGETVFYKYDALHRLESVKNKDGHILKAYEYHLIKPIDSTISDTETQAKNEN